MSEPGKTILIVDDDSDFRASVGSFLEVHGFRVLQAKSGREGRETALLEHPDLVLLDIMMGERTEGMFTAQEFDRDPRLRQIPLFVVSSIYADVKGFRITPESSWLRHDLFLPKPVDFDLLLRRIREWTEMPEKCPPRSGTGGPQ